MLNPDYRDILSIFSEEKVEFLLVGAYAMAVHGLPRSTGDIDLWVRSDRENAERIIRALTVFDAPLSEIGDNDFLTPGLVVQIGVMPRRIDILTSIDGVEFAEAWAERLDIEVEGIGIPVISRRHLIRNKLTVGRLKDTADAQWLEDSEK